MKPVRFKLAIEQPNTHLVQIEMLIRGLEDEGSVDLCLPVWTPGSYLVREYAQFARVIRAQDSNGRRREVHKLDKSRWRVDAAGAFEVTVTYEVYAHTLNVRYSHVENDHAFLHGPSLFMYPEGRLSDEVELHLSLPDGWKTFTGLSQPEPSPNYLEAHDFDELYDGPILAGPDLEVLEFDAAGVPHRFVIWGRGNHPADRLASDTRRIVEASAKMFGGEVPYDDFGFLTLLTQSDYGGLEHRNSTALMYPRHAFVDPDSEEELDDKYIDFLGLVSHEHFHVWNVKRIHPERLGPFDYQNENYTRDLWTVEGITSYYTNVSLMRAGLIDGAKLLEIFGKQLKALHDVPGRKVSSLLDASFDAWIRSYRPHPNNRNNNVSYYLKGALAAMVLDVSIRVDSDGEKSLDDVMRFLWSHYSGAVGYPEGGFQTIVADAVGQDVGEFFDVFIRGTQDPDWDDWLENIGLQVVTETADNAPPFFGFDHSGGAVKTVWAKGPAELGGLQSGDKIVAVDGFEATDVDALLKSCRVDETVRLHVFRRGELTELLVQPEPARPHKWSILPREDAGEAATRLLEGWLGGPLEVT